MGIIGTGELIVLMVVTLIVFGPHRLPELARFIAKAMRMFQDASRDLQKQLELSDWDLEAPPRKSIKHESDAASTGSDSYTYPYEPPPDASRPGGNHEESASDAGGYPDNSNNNPASPGDDAQEEAASMPSRDTAALNDPAKVQDAQRYGREMLD